MHSTGLSLNFFILMTLAFIFTGCLRGVSENTTLNAEPVFYALGGTVSGLSGVLLLQNNNGEKITIYSGANDFIFKNKLPSGTPYHVQIIEQPILQKCSLQNDQGLIGPESQNAMVVTCIEIVSGPAPDTTAPVLSSNKISIAALATDGGSATISWSKASDGVSEQSKLTYKVYVSGANPSYGSFDSLAEVEAGSLFSNDVDISSKQVTGLVSGNAYYFNIVVSDEAGNKRVYAPLGELAKSSLSLYYPFNGDASDVAGTNHGTVSGDAALTTDRFGFTGSAYAFDGNGDFITSANNVGITGSANRTLAVWIKIAASPSVTGIIASWGDDIVSNTFGLYFASGGNMIGWGFGDDTDSGDAITTDWEFWAMTYDGANVNLYKNGVLTAGPDAKTYSTINSQLRVGYRPPTFTGVVNSTHYFTGSEDDVRIYSTVLTASEIANLYAVTHP